MAKSDVKESKEKGVFSFVGTEESNDVVDRGIVKIKKNINEEKGELSLSSTKDGNDVGETGILKIQKNLNVMAESLRCPLCLSTLNNPCVLPCLHSFCSQCINLALENKRTSCPVCSVRYSKRSVRPSSQLAEIVLAFQKSTKAFGLAPMVYDPGLDMTQVEGGDSQETDLTQGVRLSRLWKDEFEKRAGDSALYSHKLKQQHQIVRVNEAHLLSKRRRIEPSLSHSIQEEPELPTLSHNSNTIQEVEEPIPDINITDSQLTDDFFFSATAFSQSLRPTPQQHSTHSKPTRTNSKQPSTHSKQTSTLSNEPSTHPKQPSTHSNHPRTNSKQLSTPQFAIGSIVQVASRTSPGMNKPGGIARITKIQSQSLYDVAYVLGGREKMVHEDFLSQHNTISTRTRHKPNVPISGQENPSKSKPQPAQPQPPPSTEENLYTSATTHYRTLFQKAHEKKNYYIVITAVNDHVKSQVDSLISAMKQKHFTIKIQNDVTPQTNLCITTPSPTLKRQCRSRTLKTMRAALLGIPIVASQYLSLCIDNKSIIAPNASETYCMESLPTKAAFRSLLDQGAEDAVIRYAARLSNTPLFSNTIVLLCGAWEKGNGPKKKDVSTLLKDGGATILPSPTALSKKLQSKSPTTHYIILCDDSTTDEQGGITFSLFETVRNASSRNVKVVGSAWLFDSISCGCVLERKEKVLFYPPLSPRAKSLWKECCK